MAGHGKFNELRARMSPGRRARSHKATKRMLAEMPLTEASLVEMPLAELRQARQLTQETLAELLQTSQPEVSKIERRTDVYVSTLRHYVEALGGRLEIIALLPEGAVRINQFHDLAESA